MTRHLIDIATYQGALVPDTLPAAGFGGVNLKISHGLGQQSVHLQVASWAAAAKRLGLGISTFHWLTADASGEAQAEYAYGRLRALGLEAGTVHQLDVESQPAPSLASVRGYLTRMTALLGRPVVLYTGDWWWVPRGWDVSDLTPYLWAAPNAGYPGQYPGDSSEKWRAGYGGWADLAVMQYAVKVLPGTSIKVSMSAVRDEEVWRALIGQAGRPGMSYSPTKISEARTLVMNTLRAAGETVVPASFGVVGDDSHANAGTSYHLGKDALQSNAYSIVESSRDRNGLTNAASAFDWGDFSIVVKGKRHDLKSMSLWMVAQCKANTPDSRDLREIIYSPDGSTVKRWDRLGIRTTGPANHTTHTHFSWFRDSENRDKTALFRRYFTEIGLLEEPDMPIENADVTTIATAKVWPAPAPLGIEGPMTLQDLLTRIFLRANGANDTAIALRTAFTAFAAAEQGDDAAKAAALAQLRADLDAVPADVLSALGRSTQTDAEVAAALKAALGARSGPVGALLQQ